MSHPRVTAWLLGHRTAIYLLTLALVGVSALAATRFRIDPDVAHFFPQDPVLELTRSLYGAESPSRMMTVILRAKDLRELEAVLPPLIESLEASAHVARVDGTRVDFLGPRHAWMKRSPLAFLPPDVVDRIQARVDGDERLAALEKSSQVLTDGDFDSAWLVQRDVLGLRFVTRDLELGSRYMMFDDPPTAMLRVIGAADWTDMPFSKALVADLDARVGRALAGRPVEHEVFGAYSSALSRAREFSRDLGFQALSSLVLVFLFLLSFTRRWIASVLMLLPAVLGLTITLSSAGALLGPLSPLAVSVAAILIAQGIDFPIHFFSRYRAERAGHDPEAAFTRTHRALVKPLFAGAATTACAFLSFTASAFPGFREFGIILAFGLVVTLIATVTVYGLLVTSLDDRGPPPSPAVPRMIDWAISLDRTQARTWVAATTLAVMVAAWIVIVAGGVRIDLDPRSVAPGNDPGDQVLTRLETQLGASPIPIFALVGRDTPISSLREAGAALLREDAIASWIGPDALDPSPQARDRQQRFVSETRGWVERARSDVERVGLEPDDFIESLEKLEALITSAPPDVAELDAERFSELKAQHVRGDDWVIRIFPKTTLFDGAARAQLTDRLRAHLGDHARVLSALHMPDHFSVLLERDARRLALLALVIVFLTCVLTVGRDSLLTMLPPFAGAGVALAYAALHDVPVNPMNMAAAPIIVGAGVDDALHFLAALRSTGSVERALRDVGPAVWGTTVTTVLGFGSLSFSSTPGIASLGVLVSIGMTVALLVTLFALPALVRTRA